MTAAADLYPPSVADVPRGLTRPGIRYLLATLLVLTSVLLFLLFYLALIAGAGYLVYLAWTFPLPQVTGLRGMLGLLLLKGGAVAIAVMLFFFLVKGLFKRGELEEPYFVEVTPSEHPELFTFIRRLCQDRKAPYPHRVYLTPEVNAEMLYRRSFWSLFRTAKKDLVLGIGLVNVLTISELKAVIAHELGHFSQRDLPLSGYVYRANAVIYDLVWGEDFFDEWLASWREMDLRPAIFGHLLAGIVWILKRILFAAFWVINLLHAGHSRETEFHADLVAVSVCGSETHANALFRVRFAGRSFAQTLHELSQLTSRGLLTRDAYHHQAEAAEYLRRVSNDPRLGIPPPITNDPQRAPRLFQPGDGELPSHWASHPPPYDREQHAKRKFVPSVADDRPAWLLFRNPQEVRELLTVRLYADYLHLPMQAQLSDPQRVQEAIAELRVRRRSIRATTASTTAACWSWAT
ncbi:MAG: M48 family metallopeptidase [Armatimonadota bacterium]